MQCTQALVAVGLVIAGATGSLAGFDEPHAGAETTCLNVFAPGNPDVRTSGERAKLLQQACREGVALARVAAHQPRFDSAPDFTVYKRLRADNREAAVSCTRRYDDKAQLQQRMACLDGSDYYSGLHIQSRHGILDGPKPKVRFDPAWYAAQDYDTLYWDLDDGEWAFVLADRVAHPRNYPDERRDALFVPRLTEKQEPVAEAFQRNRVYDPNYPATDPTASAWFWWWHALHYRTCYICGSAPTTYFNPNTYERGVLRPSVEAGAGPAPTPPKFYGPRAHDPVAINPTPPPSDSAALVRGGLGAFGGHVNSSQSGVIAKIPTFDSYSGNSPARLPNAVAPAARSGRANVPPATSSVPMPSPARPAVTAPIVTARPTPVMTAPARVSISPSISISSGG